MNMSVITVGSINIDLIAYCNRSPSQGETLLGDRFSIRVGGKGANQAIRVSISGGNSIFIGKAGQDIFAEMIKNHFCQCNVDTSFIKYEPTNTGIGHVRAINGNYDTVIVPGANELLSIRDVDDALPAFRRSSAILLQLETPMETVIHAAKVAKENGLIVCLNAAPSKTLPSDFLGLLDILVVNEIEAQMLSGVSKLSITNDYQGIARLLSRWAPNIVISLGSEGVFARNIDGQAVYYPAHRVNAISSIGAGDSLISELIVRMLEGMPFFEAVQRANAVAATVVASANGLLSRADESSIMNLLKENIKYNIFSS